MTDKLESDRARLGKLIAKQREKDRMIGFVPTMGYLHEGHQSLIRASASDGCFSVVSIFVNPAQFGPNEDLERYPRDPERDFELCREAGADLVWYPEVNDLYPPGAETAVVPGALAKRLCGLSRPLFFGGICTVVLKFFNLIRPDIAYFGEKDYQQLAIIRKMVEDFFLDIKVVGGVTVREPDGLAMSSRNARLTSGDRETALTLYRTIQAAQRAYKEGERDAERLLNRLAGDWPVALELDYLEFRNPTHLEKAQKLESDTRLFLGVWLHGIRLIDNAPLGSTHQCVMRDRNNLPSC